MEKIAFIGGYDKTDLIMLVAKTIEYMGKKVLVIDATGIQKSRFIIPTMQAEKQYIATHEKVDVAIGFQSLDEIKKYKQMETKENFEYDYILVDIDSYKAYYYFGIKTEDKKYFVTSFDLYSLRKGLQVFKRLETPTEVTKVEFTKEMLPDEDNYLNYLSKSLKIKWNSDIIYFPFDTSDLNAIYVNQRTGRIRIRGLSTQYTDGISYIAQDITNCSDGDIKKAFRLLEKN